MVVALLAEEPPRDTGPDFGKASPFGLLIVVLLMIGTFLLVWSMNRHLKRLPESFDREQSRTRSGRRRRNGRRGRPTPPPAARVRRVSPAVNALGEATSPYLRQHADNPVHWQQWTPEALAEAAARDVPILLSIGYAACHWCHVMAHESFEDDEVAATMNAGFVCIKVDREERPDLDAVYMNATVALTGQGGWPMTCFLTPDGRPFFCGTYYPSPVSCNCSPPSSTPGAIDARRSSRPRIRSRVSCGRWRPGCPVAVRLCSPHCVITRWPACCATRTPPAADLAVRRSFRRRRSWKRCCAPTNEPATCYAGGRRADLHGDGTRRHI